MVRMAVWLRSGLNLAGGLLWVAVGLLVLLLVVSVARPVILIVALVALVGAVGYAASPMFRTWLDTRVGEQVCYKGLRLASGVAMHPSHSWARMLPRHVLVGADDLVQAVLGPVQEVELPPVGTRVQAGDGLFFLRHGARNVEVCAPVTGTVVARNESLVRHPRWVNDEPFARGWAVRLRAENVTEESHRLLQGNEARTWFGREIDRLMASLHGQEGVETSLADGGALVDDLYRHIDDEAWKRLTESFFGPKA